MSKEKPTIVGIDIHALHYGDTAYLTVPLDPKFTPIEIRHESRTPSPTKHGESAYHFTDVGSDAGTIKCDRYGAVHTVVCLGELGILTGLSPKHMRVVLDNPETSSDSEVLSVQRDPHGVEPRVTGEVNVKPITKEQDEIRKLQDTIQAMNIERENLLTTIQANAEEMRAMRGELLDAHDIALHVEPGYLQLANILRGALQQAQHGKGAERHADDKPFHQQPIIAINEILGSVDGLAYQVIKKVKESKGLPTLDAKLREIYGAINYAAAMAIMYRNAETGEVGDE